MSHLQNQKGFSLVEVMLVAALSGVVALGVAKLTESQMKSVKTVEAKFEYTSVFNHIRNILGDRISCTETFNGGTLQNYRAVGFLTAIEQKLTTGQIVSHYPAEKSVAGLLKIVSYRIDYPSPAVSPLGFDPANSKLGQVDLIIAFDYGVGSDGFSKIYSSQIIERKFPIQVELSLPANDPNASIKNCSASGAQDDYVNVSGDEMHGHLVMTGDAEIHMESDRRLKQDIHSLDPVLSKVIQLRPVSYSWKGKGGETDLGLIAQDVQKIFPELVHQKDNEILTVNYLKITPLLIQSVKELKQENSDLKKDLEEIKTSLCKNEQRASYCVGR